MRTNLLKPIGHLAIAGFMGTAVYLLDNSGLWVGAKKETTNAFTACGYIGAAVFATSALVQLSRGAA